MSDRAKGGLFALVMVVVIVSVDLLFFRGKDMTWERLAANVAIVAVAAVIYLKLLR